MNPDQPSREQIEARITALLLGELPADEAALLRYTIAQDPALKKHCMTNCKRRSRSSAKPQKHPADAPLEKLRAAETFRRAPRNIARAFQDAAASNSRERLKTQPDPLFWLKRICVCRRSSKYW